MYLHRELGRIMAISRPVSRQPIPPEARKVFQGALFAVYQWEQELYDGSTAVFEKIQRPDTAYVIPVTDDGLLALAEQVQPGGTRSIGLLGGRIKDGESPEEGARRELLEEAGVVAARLELWDSYQFLPKLEWAIYTFVARGLRSVGGPSLDAGERINVIYASFDEFVALVARDEFGDLEVALRVLRLSHDPQRLEEIRRLFCG